MKKNILLFTASMLCAFQSYAQSIDLSGEWKFSMGDKPEMNDRIELPGSMLTNGKGNDVSVSTQWVSSLYDSSYYYNPYMEQYRREGNIKFPFFLTPDKHYVGNAWYEKTVTIPKEWKSKRIILHLERPHIETNVFINGKLAGRDSSLSAPHEFEITRYIRFGKENTIRVKVYNGIENVCVGQDSHSVTDQTQGCWNGIAGEISLTARPRTFISSVQVFPDVQAKSIDIVVGITGGKKRQQVTFKVNGTTTEKQLVFDDKGYARTTLPMGNEVELWDEFNPHLYTLQTITGTDTVNTGFGMREIAIKGRQFYMNNRPIWMRGTVENCCFPLTGYPPTDVQSWMNVFRKCKEYGLNMMRFHSYCPPEAAFIAADSLGFYLQPEGPSWPNHGVKLGQGMSIDRYLLEETRCMVEQYGNHPSFCMLAAGNEPAGNWVKWVGDFVDYWKSTGDTRRVYCGASVGGGWAFDPKSEYHVKGGARGLDWKNNAPQSTDDYYKNITSFTQRGRKPITFDINEPLLSHEAGQWCAFPDLTETSQYTGAYKARNFEIFADLLRDNGMEGMSHKFLLASGKLQTLAYKYEIERNLRTKEYAGFQLLSLNDYSGQGTALVGVLNVFWREKGYCTAADWKQFCAPAVPLAQFPKFIYTNDETLNVPVEMYNAYSEALRQTRCTYTISSENGLTVAKGKLLDGEIPVGKNFALGRITLSLKEIQTPQKLTLRVSASADNAPELQIANQWDFWVYPKQLPMPSAEGIYTTDTLDEKAIEILGKGGKVLITAAGKIRLGADVVQNYMPVFWNTSWFKMRPPHTTGLTIDTDHPLFRNFPTDDWANLNWWELINKAQVMNLMELPKSYQPMIQPIDTWHISRKLGMAIEANVLNGKVFMTTMDIDTDLDNRVVARQMRKAIISYMRSTEFRPDITLSPQTITDFFTKDGPKVSMFTKDSPDELKPKLK